MTTWHFVIKNADDDYWNNTLGWVKYRQAADYFDTTSLSLPMGGRWVKTPNVVAFRHALQMVKHTKHTMIFDKHRWCLTWLYDMCGHAIVVRNITLPENVKYSVGVLGPCDSAYPGRRMLLRTFTDGQLMYCINALHRYRKLLVKYEVCNDF